MHERRECRKYTFTVEGETERWYLLWLQDQVNNHECRRYDVKIDAKVQPSPRKYYKIINSRTTHEVVHVCDVESMEQEYVTRFKRILAELKEAKTQKDIQYYLGYSNFTFELWIILHRQDCNGKLNHRREYLKFINAAFGENFVSLDKYKEEANFKRCLSKMSLENVKNAISRAEKIVSFNNMVQNSWKEYCGYKYCKDNPATSVHEAVRKILLECGIL